MIYAQLEMIIDYTQTIISIMNDYNQPKFTNNYYNDYTLL